MNVFYSRESLSRALADKKSKSNSIGFVPTMGALHEGHLALVRTALSQVDCVVVSIFVNPTQFNNPADLENYPRFLDKDIEFLSTVGEVLVFAPSYDEVYSKNDDFIPIDLKGLDKVLEGEFRPGHFEGVVHVVRNLFQIVQPDKAFFGLKDFQQVAVIRLMIQTLQLPVELVPCETLRNNLGLALSSRNLRLSESEQQDALIIIKTLKLLKGFNKSITPSEAREKAIEFFNQGNLKLEYLEIVDDTTLQKLTTDWAEKSSCCIAAFCGEVRLIDNIQL